jgi:hypothetical protein
MCPIYSAHSVWICSRAAAALPEFEAVRDLDTSHRTVVSRLL